MNKLTIFNKKRLILILSLALMMLAVNVSLALAQAASPATAGVVDAGGTFNCALTPSGEVNCWGINTNGQVTGTPDSAIHFGTQPGPYTQVSSGSEHTCALTPSGAVECWGDNDYGRLSGTSDSTIQFSTHPGPYTQVSAGYTHTCALMPSGAVDCWGDNDGGQLSGTSDYTIHFSTQAGPYTQVSAGYTYTCALTPSGAVDCWGDNFSGQAVDQPGPYTQVSAGQKHTCALKPAGEVDCWGDNGFSQVSGTPDSTIQFATQPGPYTQVSAGHTHTCALKPSGAVDCWGYNRLGPVSGTLDPAINFATQPGPYTHVSAGASHTCALTPSGAVVCWGSDSGGQVSGTPDYTIHFGTLPGPYDAYLPETTIDSAPADPSYGGVTFIFSSDLTGATFECQMDAGGWSPCASPITYFILAAEQHTFEVRAINASGGSDLTPASTTWTVASVPPAPGGVVDVGRDHTCALTPSGVVECWGDNRWGQLSGTPDSTIHFGSQPGPYTQVSTGDFHTCALTPSGAVDCWGDDSYGELNGTRDLTHHFSTLPGPYTQVSVSANHTCALKSSGTVDCWGWNYFGAVSGMPGNSYDIRFSAHPGSYTQVSSGIAHTCALTSSGAVDCWGLNYYGELSGTPDSIIHFSTQPGPYTQVTLGSSHTCALTPSGAVDCWGYNSFGQVVDQPGPYTQVSLGSAYSCALTPSGAADCWGQNAYGQATDQPGPYTEVSAGGTHTCALTPSAAVDCWGLNGVGEGVDQPGPYGPYVPQPVLIALNPASAAASSEDLTLTVSGSDFVDGSVILWNGAILETSFVSDTQLTALIPAGSLASVQTAQVTVYTPAPGGGTSQVLPFFITQAPANVIGQDVVSGTDPGAVFGPATVAATGDGLLAVAQYDANPGGTPSFIDSGSYFVVYAAPGNTFSQVSIVICNLNNGDKLYWWDSGTDKWMKADPQTCDSTSGCVTLIVTATSSPSLSQLQGTIFALGNTAPVANPSGPYMAAIDTAISFDGSLSSDAEDDSLTYAWTFGDDGTGVEAQPSHSYTATGVYDVCLTVNDGTVDSTPVCTIAVVYDPSGGFVTGGGWIDSPAGAYLPDPTLTGKATFGFVSKYQKGNNIPTGNTAFNFDVAGLSFASQNYEWLVVNQNGTNAQFKGSGLLNGLLDPNGQSYKFMVWAGDGSPDTFRIRIWYEDTTGEHDVYDNGVDQSTGGGNIVVHTGN